MLFRRQAALAIAIILSIGARAQADDLPPIPVHVGEPDNVASARLDTLKSGFSQFGAASGTAARESEDADNSHASTNRGEKLSLPQGAFPVKKSSGTSTSRTVAEPANAPRLPGDRVAWQGAFRAVPVPRAAVSAVVQTAGQLPLDPDKTVMLPMPSAADLRGETDAKQPARQQNTEVPVGAASDPTIVHNYSGEAPFSDLPNCKSARDLKSIRSITADISIKRQDLTGGKHLPPDCPLGAERLEARHWQPTTFSWCAAATYHKPIYFDDDQLERYGHTFGPVTQTTLSAVKFFATVPLVPYYMGVYPPNESIYDLGTYRPGSCSPYYCDPFPLSVRGAINEMSLGIMPAL
jgi:hypothetical protein